MISVSKLIQERFGEKAAQLYRFVLVGAFVTLLSVFLSYLFLKILATPLVITYILLYMGTIFISYLLNASYTFTAQKSLKRLLQFYGTYVFTLLVGTGGLMTLRRYLDYENWILVLLIMPVTMLTNFVLSSLIFKISGNKQ